MKTSRLPPLATLGLAALAAAIPDRARAESGDLSVGGELGVGSMLSAYQRDTLKYGLDIQGSLRPGISLMERLTLQAALGGWWFPSDQGYGRATFLGAGLRFDPPVSTSGRLFVDSHAGAGFTGGLKRFAFDAGVGFEFEALPAIGIGPVLRYGQIATSGSDVPTDAKFWSVGVSIMWHAAPAAPPPPPAAPPAPPPPPEPAPPPPPVPVPAPKPAAPAKKVADSDSDGVLDDKDVCPTTAAGLWPDPDRPGCPDGDDDNDGVMNHNDKCPAQHKGYQPDPERRGCPLPDRDNDSVPDATDACPDKPGAPNANAKRNGCPGLVLVSSGHIKIKKPVFFATNKDKILFNSAAVLKAVGDALKVTPEIRKVSIEGHTDGIGNWEKNMDLSRRRAESVRAWLIKIGIDEGRLEANGFGDSKPLGSNKTAKGRSENRRVEFVILDPPSPPSQ